MDAINRIMDVIKRITSEFKIYMQGLDGWVKKINKDITDFSDAIHIVNENVNNTDYNFQLIQELRDDIDDLKQEIKALKLIQIINLKNKQQ